MEKEQDVHPDHQRKSISLTHKQAGTIGAITAASLLVQPLFDVFQTKDLSDAKMQVIQVQMDVQKRSIDELKAEVKTVNDNVITSRKDLLTTINEFSREQRQRDLEADSRQKDIDDRQDRRMELLEANQIYGRKPASKN